MMKFIKNSKISICSLLLLLILLSISNTVEGSGFVNINVNGIPMEFSADSKPYISKEGRTMVPLRAISTYFNCDVDWLPNGMYETGNVYITPKEQTGNYEMSYEFYIGIKKYRYCGPNGEAGIVLNSSNDGEMKIWGGSLDKEFSLYMKELAPGADAIPLGKFVVYSDASESNGFLHYEKVYF